MSAADDREYWTRVLAAGGTTAVPRWVTDPAPGIGEHVAAIPTAVLAALDTQPYGPDLPFDSLLLTAHAAVLAALSGELDVVTGYVPAGADGPLPCPLSVAPATWRELVDRTRAAERELLDHADFPVEELLRPTGPRSDTIFGAAGDLPDDAVLWVAAIAFDGRPALRLRYRRDALNGEAAARIAGYHLTALHRLATEPDDACDRHSLLSAEEIAFQLDGLAGPHRELPDHRFHELFEQRVRRHPDAVAAEHEGRQWTYRELNARANRIGHALVARGLGRESVVAVTTERNLDWMASVIGIFKAGGVYLPVEPHLPADRIAGVLRRAECAAVLTEPGSTTTLDQALRARPEVQRVLVEDVYAEDHSDTDLGLPVGPDQLAYIYFTSGSTGEPKGAMCEHAGMLNHLQAKLADLEIGEGQTVAQTAPQSFDISLWQLIAAALVGGRTLLVPQDVILDVARFVDTIADGGVHVAQLVPSYLEVVLTYLEQNSHALPDLHCCSVTGEALKLELAQRWFSVLPGIKLVNAYGLTETSDDTNHEVMRAAPEGRSVPLGKAVQNVRVYVVDEQLRPVPLGAPGAIVFSGVCVGRGYINDPDRTAAAYLTDPHHPGERLYQAGDFGRWRPDGKLEYLGRRDSQVKISGFRIEIGEIENTLLRVPGVRDGAVVVAEPVGGNKHLVAFYAADRPLPVEELRERLAASLPGYMVPTAFHWRDALPLTANSKIDKKALAALAAELDGRAIGSGDEDLEPPATPTEQRLAQVWATVLGEPVAQVGRRDHFFDKGGTSLTAVKVVIALKREVSLGDITRLPVLADLAALIDGRSERRTGLLQVLAEPAAADAAMVCFPYAGGNAVNFRPLADALRDSRIAVFAVELPGHDLTAEREPFTSIEQVVARVVAELENELRTRELRRVMLWGHSSGTALAVAAARALHERGVEVARLFLAAQLPRDAAARRTEADQLIGRGAADIAADLAGEAGYPELDAQRAAHVGAAYRHDCVTANRYLADLLEAPAAPLPAPVTVVLAADDPSTAEFGHRHQEWQLVTEHVDLELLPDGGHHFLRTRPSAAADVVRRAARLLLSR